MVESKTYMFDVIKNNFTDELYKWMKIEFSDVCSNGDVCINELLDEINSVYNIKNKIEMSIDIEFINYIYDSFTNKIRGQPLFLFFI